MINTFINPVTDQKNFGLKKYVPMQARPFNLMTFWCSGVKKLLWEIRLWGAQQCKPRWLTKLKAKKLSTSLSGVASMAPSAQTSLSYNTRDLTTCRRDCGKSCGSRFPSPFHRILHFTIKNMVHKKRFEGVEIISIRT